jgi:hypothetical protein
MYKLSLVIIILLTIWQVSGQTSPHGSGFKIDCTQCHTSESWKVKTSSITFNHDNTGFILAGQHKSTDCKACHTLLLFKDKRHNCVECHTDVHNQSVGKECGRCHTSKNWIVSNITEIHQQSRFPLQGAHRNVNCTECHKSASKLYFEPLGIQCVNCHQKDFQLAVNPNHVTGKFSTNCLDCHNENTIGWHSGLVNHDFFPLEGGHAIGCVQCHTSGKFGKISKECNYCHNKNFTSAQQPKHSEAGISVKCESCHTTKVWRPSLFNHTTTGYELKGAHKNVAQCSQCHKGNITSAPQNCVGCHQPQYDSALGHKANAFSTDCTKCHSQDNWLATSYDHSTTNFPLTGAHKSVQCSLCHVKVYTGTPTVCSGCHLTVYNSSKLPDHLVAGIPKDCQTCHNTNGWKPSVFNHTTTGYELKGAHKSIVQCSQCHKGNVTAAPQNCIGCHQSQYDSAPGHKANAFSTDCSKCHSQDNWLATSYDHSTTNFPLTGAHKSVLCSLCHTKGYTGTPTACSSCHITVYNNSKLPDHNLAGIPKECPTCHTTTAWKPSSFNHSLTGYILQGAHKNIVQCSACHLGNLTSALKTCIGCHQARYNTAANHKVQNYPVDCTICHTQNNWLESIFNHSTTSFPLTGAHTSVLCSKCHTTGFKGTPTQCYSCHASKYNATINPNHSTAKFPTTCESCHKTSAWTPATYNHDTQYFPIYSGKHKGAWTLCSECHNVATNYAAFSCILCHEHSNKTSVDGDHKGIKNYSYVSSACYNCHPTGR